MLKSLFKIFPVISIFILVFFPETKAQNTIIFMLKNLDLNKQVRPSLSKEEKKFQEIMKYASHQNLYKKQMGQILQTISYKLLGAKYQAGLLDKSEQENLVISLDRFDCVLFIETVLALSRGIAEQNYQYQTFVNYIQDQRYWNGQINGYCSRLHYFSAWIYENQRRGNVQEITVSLGGIKLNKKLNFMSTHRHLYPQLIKNEANYQCIKYVEKALEGLQIYYIPSQQILSIYPYLQPGDIIGVVTSIPGLDVTHTGLIYQTSGGNIGLIHASPAGQVTIASDLQRYINNVDQAIGIVIARPLDPRKIN